jgi:two-component system NtrC family sensor kinase
MLRTVFNCSGHIPVRIASKINAALIIAFACGTLATFGVLRSIIAPRFDEIERGSAQLNHKRVMDAFDAFTEKLQTATQDYAFWDESYGFLQGEKVDEFIASNLAPEFKAVENLGVNALVFLHNDGSVMWGAAYDLETKETIAGMVDEIAHFSRSHPYIGRTSPAAKRGIIRTSKGLLLIAIAPVLKSDRSGDAVGKVISAKLLDVDAVKQLTGVEFTLEPYRSAGNRPDTGETETAALDDRIETTSVVSNIVGRPLVLLRAQSPRDVSRAGAAAIRSAMMMMILAGLAALAVLWAFLRHTVISPISKLKRHFATAGTSGTITRTSLTDGRDEIGDLARSFNGMAEQVNHLRDALADSAYMTGLSEWAAGTLHNVRNGLVPVAASTWQVDKLFDATWIKNIEAAAAEHADAGTEPERRGKLNAYLVGSAARFAETAKRTTELTAKINGASQSVLDMVAEFERYAHRKIEVEAIDALPLIESSAVTAIESRSKDVELILPKTSATISGNGIVLRQVFSNIIVNAIEAIDGQHRRGRIEISIETSIADAGLTRIAITDNGEGLSPDRLAAIFQRGVSSRQTRSGGLGLHWCANAIQVLGGTIRAESSGIGMGASIIIEIPTFATTQKEAA